jgi:hypothetical protein
MIIIIQKLMFGQACYEIQDLFTSKECPSTIDSLLLSRSHYPSEDEEVLNLRKTDANKCCNLINITFLLWDYLYFLIYSSFLLSSLEKSSLEKSRRL